MNSKQSLSLQNYQDVPANTRRWSVLTGLIRWAVRALLRLLKDLRSDAETIAQGVKDVWNGPELDPKRFAKEPPAWWHIKTPVADVKTKPKKAGNVVDFDVYTPEEILEMSQAEYAVKVGGIGIQDWQTTRKRAARESQKVRAETYDFDGDDVLTERDKGEMLAHTPPLNNEHLARAIKAGIQEGKSLLEISAQTGFSVPYIKMYSACLTAAKRPANPSPTSSRGV